MDMAYFYSLAIMHMHLYDNMVTGECLKWLMWKMEKRFDKGNTIGLQVKTQLTGDIINKL